MDLWVVIHAFNAGPVISEVVMAVRTLCDNVVVVDDCSDDDTGAQALAAGATVLRHPINLGQGAALQTGIRYALRAFGTLRFWRAFSRAHARADALIYDEIARRRTAP